MQKIKSLSPYNSSKGRRFHLSYLPKQKTGKAWGPISQREGINSVGSTAGFVSVEAESQLEAEKKLRIAIEEKEDSL